MYPPHLFICFFDEWPFRGDESRGKSVAITFYIKHPF